MKDEIIKLTKKSKDLFKIAKVMDKYKKRWGRDKISNGFIIKAWREK